MHATLGRVAGLFIPGKHYKGHGPAIAATGPGGAPAPSQPAGASAQPAGTATATNRVPQEYYDAFCRAMYLTCAMYEQTELYSPGRKVIQIHVLRAMVIVLMRQFNLRFDEYVVFKEDCIARINDRNERIDIILGELQQHVELLERQVDAEHEFVAKQESLKKRRVAHEEEDDEEEDTSAMGESGLGHSLTRDARLDSTMEESIRGTDDVIGLTDGLGGTMGMSAARGRRGTLAGDHKVAEGDEETAMLRLLEAALASVKAGLKAAAKDVFRPSMSMMEVPHTLLVVDEANVPGFEGDVSTGFGTRHTKDEGSSTEQALYEMMGGKLDGRQEGKDLIEEGLSVLYGWMRSGEIT